MSTELLEGETFFIVSGEKNHLGDREPVMAIDEWATDSLGIVLEDEDDALSKTTMLGNIAITHCIASEGSVIISSQELDSNSHLITITFGPELVQALGKFINEHVKGGDHQT